jgi:hypothetical protein
MEYRLERAEIKSSRERKITSIGSRWDFVFQKVGRAACSRVQTVVGVAKTRHAVAVSKRRERDVFCISSSSAMHLIVKPV